MDWTEATAPDAADIEAMALNALERLPEAFRAYAREVVLRIEDLASDEMLDGLGIQDPFELTGLYDGIPLTEKSVSDQPTQPDASWSMNWRITSAGRTRISPPLTNGGPECAQFCPRLDTAQTTLAAAARRVCVFRTR